MTNENTDGLVMNDINISDIQRTHRLGPAKKTRETRNSKTSPRPIIFKLVNFRKRMEIFLAKKRWKGKSIAITENLTSEKYKLVKSVSDHVGRGNAWSIEGRIMRKWKNNIGHINKQADVHLLK